MKPFHEELAVILEEREVSGRELARLTRSKAGWGAAGTMALYLQGISPPTIEGMEAISKALNIDPTTFAAYRMAVLRNDLNPERVGWERAAETLRLWEGE